MNPIFIIGEIRHLLRWNGTDVSLTEIFSHADSRQGAYGLGAFRLTDQVRCKTMGDHHAPPGTWSEP